MADESRAVIMTVECTHCKTKQNVKVNARPGFGQMGNQSIPCVNCKREFDVMVPDKIVGGPFPV